MATTFLFHDVIFGPVKSRRLGISLGINLSPTHTKWCNYNCLYCECGWNPVAGSKPVLPSKEEVIQKLRETLVLMQEKGEKPDVITFSGNGEPTMHPSFEWIVDEVINLRNSFCSGARIAVLSNASLLHKESVFRALQKVDDPILKLDSGGERMSRIINQPAYPFDLEKHLQEMEKFEGNFILQSIFLRGRYQEEMFDNTNEDELCRWMKHVKRLNPRKVMIYSLDRATPHPDLEKVSLEELERIAQKLRSEGFDVQVA